MPTYKKKATASRAILNWHGYRFPQNVEVITDGFVKPHDDLELVSAEPLPRASILMQELINFPDLAGGAKLIDIPYCDTYLMQLQVHTGSLTIVEKQVEGAVPVTVSQGMAYLTQNPIKWKNVTQVEVSSTVAASGSLIIEHA